MLKYNEWIFSSCDSNIEHTVTDIRLYSDDKEKIEIELKPVSVYPTDNYTMSWEDWNCYDSIRIYKTDYEILLLPAIKALFPVIDPDPNGWGVQESFDLTSMNFFGKVDWQRLINNLTVCMEVAEETKKEFYYVVIQYLEDFMTISDWFCIEGNL